MLSPIRSIRTPATRGLGSPLRRLSGLFAALLIALGLGCYDPSSILDLAVSPDGKWAAILTDKGEMGILDLKPDGGLKVLSTHAERGIGWSPDSQRLAFVERVPGEPSALWVLNLATGQRAPLPLISGPSWKADPVWLSDQTVAFLSDRDSEAANLWLVGIRADGSPDRPFMLLDPPADISRLWATSEGPSAIYQSVDGEAPALWLWRPGIEHPVRLPGAAADGFAGRGSVSFSADGRWLAYLRRTGAGEAVARYDLKEQKDLGELDIDQPASDVLVLGDGRVVVSQDKQVLIWRPDAGLFQRTEKSETWRDASLRALGRNGKSGAAVVADGTIALAASDAADLESAKMHIRNDEDVVRLASRQAQAEHYSQARELLDNLWATAPRQTEGRWLTALAQATLARMQGNWNRADRWLQEADAAAAGVDSADRSLAPLERLALAFFDRRDAEQSKKLLQEMSPAAGGAASPAASSELAGMIGNLIGRKDPKPMQAWQRIGADARQGNYGRAAREMNQAVANADLTTPALTGMRVLLDGGLDPLEQGLGVSPRAVRAMMGEIDFQEALLKALRVPSPPAPPPAELRNLLLEQWMAHGDASLARQLVAEEIKNDPARAAASASDLLRQYLTNEERPDWIDRVVSGALLEDETVRKLLGLLNDPQDRLELRLAQTRRALLAGDLNQADANLALSWEAMSALPADAQNIMKIVSGQAGGEEIASLSTRGPTAGEAAFRQARELFLAELFEAKISERKRDWSAALRAYRACQNLIDRIPADWDVAPNELIWNVGLIEQGSRDPEQLSRFLRLRDQMGDPLLDPSRDPERMRQTLANLSALEKAGVDTWLAPHVAFLKGLCRSLLKQPERALAELKRAEAMRPDVSLLQRVLLEEAALRDYLGQSAMSARLDERILALTPSLSLRAAAAMALIQSERQAGFKAAPTQRLAQLLPASSVPKAWREYLWLQVGGDLNDMDLYR